MYTDNITKYIYAGLLILPTKLVYVPRTRIKRFLRKLSVWPFLFTVGFGLMPAMALGGHWLVIAISIMLLSFAAYIAVIVLTIKDITVKKRLIMQTLVFSVMILSISWVLILYFILIYGFTVFLFLIYVPPLLVPPLAGMKYAKDLYKRQASNNLNMGPIISCFL